MKGFLKGPNGSLQMQRGWGWQGLDNSLFKKKKKKIQWKSGPWWWRDGREYKMLLKEIEIRAIRWCRLAVCVKTHPVLAPLLCRAHVKSKSKWPVRLTACTPACSSGASDAPIMQHWKKSAVILKRRSPALVSGRAHIRFMGQFASCSISL